eukprot:scaffold80909_cov62-Phaeocystis_antarctica.AAC.15
MSVTLDVSKLSGWLNADANCRESQGEHAMRGTCREWRAAALHAACRAGDAICRFIGSRARGAERTTSPASVNEFLVTACRESNGRQTMRGEVRDVHGLCAGHVLGRAHREHSAHGSDTGGVEV